jgi:hypothetical protein
MQSSLPNHAGCDLALSIEADVSWISNCSVGGGWKTIAKRFIDQLQSFVGSNCRRQTYSYFFGRLDPQSNMLD